MQNSRGAHKGGMSEAAQRRRREQQQKQPQAGGGDDKGASEAQAGAGTSPTASDGSFLDVGIIRKNLQSLRVVQILLFMLGGSGAGVLGWTGWYGIAGFFLTHLFVALAVLLVIGCRPRDYFNLDPVSYAMYGAFGQLMGYVVFWSLAYTLVHVYE